MNGIPVLMYHALETAEHPSGAKDHGEHRYVLQVKQFREQLEYLHKEGFRTFLLQELLDLEEWPDKAVVLTFDDGHESNFLLALPLLHEYAFKAEFFITTDWIGTPHYMTADQVADLHAVGMGVGSHGVSHKFLDDMSDSEVERELRESREALARVIEREVVSFSAPGGRLRPGATAMAERLGYRIVCTSQPGVLVRSTPTLSIPRFALHGGTDIEMFEAMVRGNRAYIVKVTKRNNLLFSAKKVLGNNGYELVRKIMLRMTQNG